MQYALASGQWIRHTLGTDFVCNVALASDGTAYALGPDGVYAYTPVQSQGEWRVVAQKDIRLIEADRRGGVWLVESDQDNMGSVIYSRELRASPNHLRVDH